jgi:hypothetical protein
MLDQGLGVTARAARSAGAGQLCPISALKARSMAKITPKATLAISSEALR